MKTNHRRGRSKRRDHHSCRMKVGIDKGGLKYATRRNRRQVERKVTADVQAGRVDLEEVSIPTRNPELGSKWDHD